MKPPQKLKRLSVRLQKLPKKYYLFSALGLAVLLYGVTFFIPKPVDFSYAGGTCTPQLTVFPQLHSEVETDKFTVQYEDVASVGNVDIFSTETCFTPATIPEEGDVIVATAPWGGIIARKHFNLQVDAHPVANVAPLEKPIPVTKPLELVLDKTDNTFDYILEVNKKAATCDAEAKELACSVEKLKLKQGATYDYSLTRKFATSLQATKLHSGKLKTLKALQIKKTSVKNKQTVYSRPKSFSFITDKPLESASVTLVKQIKGKKPQAIPLKTELKGKTLTVKLSKELVREATYRLTVSKLDAKDGSTLVEPKKVTFAMSGGPKVTGINIGSTRTSGSAVATIQFDQALGNTDIRKYVSIKGGSATISKSSPATVSVALQGLPLCQAFSLNVAAGLPSKHKVKSKSGWSFGSRTICHTVVAYGTSVQGRPLLAYVFGNSGPVTMFTGAIHGDESSSSGLMHAWVNDLEANPGKIRGKRIVVVPTISPDGLAAGTRTNSRGVNLNRNFPTSNWQKDIDDTDGKHKGGGGKKPLSEPEAAALASLTQQYHPRLLLSFHAVGSLVQGDPGSPSAGYAATYASIVGYSNATGQGDTFDYGITGGFEQWAWENIGIPSMVIELGSYGYYSFPHHQSALWAML